MYFFLSIGVISKIICTYQTTEKETKYGNGKVYIYIYDNENKKAQLAYSTYNGIEQIIRMDNIIYVIMSVGQKHETVSIELNNPEKIVNINNIFYNIWKSNNKLIY